MTAKFRHGQIVFNSDSNKWECFKDEETAPMVELSQDGRQSLLELAIADYSLGEVIDGTVLQGGFEAPQHGIIYTAYAWENIAVNGHSLPDGIFYSSNNTVYAQPIPITLAKGDVLVCTASMGQENGTAIFYPFRGISE